jgi:signal transduction histidine kinase
MILDDALMARIEEVLGRVRTLEVVARGESARDLARVLQAAELLRDEVTRLRLDTTATGRQVRHDLRNPLGAMTGYVELLMEELDGAAFERISSIRSAAAELLALIEAIPD